MTIWCIYSGSPSKVLRSPINIRIRTDSFQNNSSAHWDAPKSSGVFARYTHIAGPLFTHSFAAWTIVRIPAVVRFFSSDKEKRRERERGRREYAILLSRRVGTANAGFAKLLCRRGVEPVREIICFGAQGREELGRCVWWILRWGILYLSNEEFRGSYSNNWIEKCIVKYYVDSMRFYVKKYFSDLIFNDGS